MHDTPFSLLFPLLFIAHNLEEMRRIEAFKQTYFRFMIPKFRDCALFKRATIFLSIFVAIIIGLNYLMTSYFLEVLSIFIFFAILMNALQHIGMSLWVRRMTPGTYTAIFLLVPYAILLFFLSRTLQLSIEHHPIVILTGSYLFMICAIYLSVVCAYLIKPH